MNHFLKIWPQHYEPLVQGYKTFEVRGNDRGFQKGDTLLLIETREDIPGIGTGRTATAVVSYVHSGLGMADGYVVLGVQNVEEHRRGRP